MSQDSQTQDDVQAQDSRSRDVKAKTGRPDLDLHKLDRFFNLCLNWCVSNPRWFSMILGFVVGTGVTGSPDPRVGLLWAFAGRGFYDLALTLIQKRRAASGDPADSSGES